MANNNGRRRWGVAREMAMFSFGLAGVVHETVTGMPDTELLLLFSAMMGLPGYMAYKREKNGD